MQLTYGDIKSTVAEAINACASDDVVKDVTNEVQERLLNKGDWANSVARFRTCVTSGCLTWSRHVERIISWANCGVPGKLRSKYWEFQSQGPGLVDQSCNSNCSSDPALSGPVALGCNSTDISMVDRDDSPVYEDMDTPSFIKVMSDEVETSKRIFLQGLDENNEWIRTTDNGSLVEGEYVTVNNSQVSTVNKFSVVTNVIKDETNGNVVLSQTDDAGTILKTIAYYEPSETKPMYRRSFIPGLCADGCGGDTDCSTKTVTVLVKLKHIPVSNDNDWLIVGNRAAFRLMATAIRYEKAERPQDAMIYEQKALGELRDEYSNRYGDETMKLQFDGYHTWGAGHLNMI